MYLVTDFSTSNRSRCLCLLSDFSLLLDLLETLDLVVALVLLVASLYSSFPSLFLFGVNDFGEMISIPDLVSLVSI